MSQVHRPLQVRYIDADGDSMGPDIYFVRLRDQLDKQVPEQRHRSRYCQYAWHASAWYLNEHLPRRIVWTVIAQLT
jgi:hypothetical protein